MIIEALKEQKNFSEIEAQLAFIVLNYGEEFSYLSIREFADLAYTSTATVQRFCKKIGCDSL
ncbi:MAG: hypothetical protein IKG46_05920 [Solobacterium sp.]|nr:hypothetical protein [Solobacterium sp.]